MRGFEKVLRMHECSYRQQAQSEWKEALRKECMMCTPVIERPAPDRMKEIRTRRMYSGPQEKALGRKSEGTRTT